MVNQSTRPESTPSRQAPVTCITGGHVYTPDDIGIADLMIVGEKILGVGAGIGPPAGIETTRIDATGRILIPGFVDLHVHLLGGGGEGGFGTRTPEMRLSPITRSGVTTVVGVLGTDNLSRTPAALLAKALQLEAEGISTAIYTGSYHLPPVTITGSVKQDIAFLPSVVGVGEIAVSDHRSSQPSVEALCRVAAEARVGGMIGGKAGLVHLHMGDGPRGLEPVFRIVQDTEIPISQFLPTHVNRKQELFSQAVGYARMGGFLDLTAGGADLEFAVPVADAVTELLESGVAIEHVTVSSDANGSMPVFDARGHLIRLAAADIGSLFSDWRMLKAAGLSMTQSLLPVTANPARRTGLFGRKGSLEPGKDADLILLTPDLEIDTVIARGRVMVRGGNIRVFGTFEEETSCDR